VLSVASCGGEAESADLTGHGDTVRSVRFSRDGKRLVTASLDGTARIWSAGGEMVAELVGGGNRVYHAEFGANDRFVLTASRDGAVRVWQNPVAGIDRSPQADLVFTADFGGIPYASFSPDGRFIAAAYWRGAAVLWRLLDPLDEEGRRSPRRAAWGDALRDLSLIGEAWRFRADNRLDELRGLPLGQD
jgi:WD40 repeat protein